jgi:hypothetical protein
MSATPPTEDPPRAGDGGALGVTRARGAERTGRNIWILVISMALAVVLVLGYWLMHAPRFHALGNERAVRTRSVTGFPVQGSSARPSPGPGQAPAAGNFQ